ncbi:Bifunctional D-cysteine desulfhydrase/1-aminocyclopropane-1-carboxylate deaminase, mitochondrial [Holothuria leucospilota]|uniref:Bifunctional D-cysteine desulfhydrase/1-aminocyclopropane-1-carboxylate deaminase, mitochondrial n=1 Tax=Holothuria leucospilota TaxID=206669 RepID=A0A9Q1H2K4_HOLLE|nr:Bifunctional D-cysteine desulfhydrase/1-aminocyclopropane-1-carboxylate deaminase, mitochondrial [Holothuria leucospilota]
MTHIFQKILPEDDTRLAVMRNDAKRRVYPYEAPDWAKNLKGMPSSKIDVRYDTTICQKFTPVQRWLLPNIPEDFEVYIKRDDMTGGAISGHKVKKLEFHLAAALKEGYKTIIGGGGNVSNYCRSIAVAGKELGFHVHLVQSSVTFKMHIISPVGKVIVSYFILSLHIIFYNLCKLFSNSEIEGQPAYVLPLGFPGDPGIFAYIDTFHELFLQGVTREYTDLVVACYSGITTSAFIIGNYLTGGNLRVHALSTRESKTQCQRIIGNILQKSGFLQHVGNGVDIGDLVSIVEASREPKYGVLYDEHIGRITVYEKTCFFFERNSL